ncbi:hypothetical protein CRI94_13120 [Longibacter salinarum]|uniref:Uncharacterized protein n=1 Tax=Longibacter salinarum TaxID=1850348 RepID=A0A2A8CX24_9BACT|nr:hypothetical protein [Longibacter salinarum]PEN12938.1 hypothetical protein CRI94_13120 [Longibacter salinarum]
MSHIDSFEHEFVGYLAGLPVYHPLEEIRGDFVCDARHIVIGGGSGEHPALVLGSPRQAVAHFLYDALSSTAESSAPQARLPLKAVVDEWLPTVESFIHSPPEELLRFYDWTEENKSHFREQFDDGVPNPYWGDRFWGWLVLGLGEFVFFAMPELAGDVLTDLGAERPHDYFQHVRYSNILLLPERMPVYANGGHAFSSFRRQRD